MNKLLKIGVVGLSIMCMTSCSFFSVNKTDEKNNSIKQNNTESVVSSIENRGNNSENSKNKDKVNKYKELENSVHELFGKIDGNTIEEVRDSVINGVANSKLNLKEILQSIGVDSSESLKVARLKLDNRVYDLVVENFCGSISSEYKYIDYLGSKDSCKDVVNSYGENVGVVIVIGSSQKQDMIKLLEENNLRTDDRFVFVVDFGEIEFINSIVK